MCAAIYVDVFLCMSDRWSRQGGLDRVGAGHEVWGHRIIEIRVEFILLVQTATISTRPNNTAGLAVIDVLCLKTTLALATVAKHARASRKVTPRWRAGSPVTNRFPFLTVITSHQYQRRYPPPPLSPLSVPFFSPAWPTIAKPLREALHQGQRGGVEGTQPHIVDQQ